MAESTNKQNQTQSRPEEGGQQRQSNRPSGQQSGGMETMRQGQRGGGMTRRGALLPSMFALSPGAVFSMGPFELMRRFTDELDQAFEGFGLTRGSESGMTRTEGFAPPVEIFERDNNLVVRAELPGMNPDDVRIELTDDGLVIEGDRTSEREESREGVYRSEIHYGHFYRLIPLPEGANLDQTQAQIDNGVLEVVIPMAESRRQRRRIQVGISGGQSKQTTGGQTQAATGGSGTR